MGACSSWAFTAMKLTFTRTAQLRDLDLTGDNLESFILHYLWHNQITNNDLLWQFIMCVLAIIVLQSAMVATWTIITVANAVSIKKPQENHTYAQTDLDLMHYSFKCMHGYIMFTLSWSDYLSKIPVLNLRYARAKNANANNMLFPMCGIFCLTTFLFIHNSEF